MAYSSQHFIYPATGPDGWVKELGLAYVLNAAGKLYIPPAHPGMAAMRDIVVHYPGADWKDFGWEDFDGDSDVDVSDTQQLIRNSHRMYILGTRGYSLGYSYYIGVLGDIHEVRGLKYKNAANLGHASKGKSGWNNYSISIHIVVNIVGGVAQPANALQVSAANWLIDYLEKKKGGSLSLYVHGDGDLTACAGIGITTQVHTGVIKRGKSIISNPPTGIPPIYVPPIEKPVEPPVVPAPTPMKGKYMSRISILELDDSDAVFIGMGAVITNDQNVITEVSLLEVTWIDGKDPEALGLLEAHRKNANTLYPRPRMNEPRSAVNRYGSWICKGLIVNEVPNGDPKKTNWSDSSFGKVG